MKFSDIAEGQWDELKPYLDTALLPLTGLGGGEAPHEATRALEQLRDALDLIEIPFKGRIVTYPAVHFAAEPDETKRQLEAVCQRLKEAGFRYIVLMTARSEDELPLAAPQHADALIRITPEQLKENAAGARQLVSETVAKLWAGEAAESSSNV